MKYYKLDKDVKQYLKYMSLDGIKTPADIYSVNDLVVGLKDLNLWQGCSVFCFRGNQNAGTGTSVYGFGNVRMYKETMLNGPTWSANGIVFNTNGQAVTKRFSIFNSPFTIIFCDKKEVLSSAMRFRYFGGPLNKYGDTNLVNTRDFNLRNSANGAISSGSPTANTNFIVKGASLDNSFFMRSYGNGALLNSATNTTAGGWDPNPEAFDKFIEVTLASDTSTICPLFCFWNLNLSGTDHSNFYNLYKVTAGKGLNLP